MPVIDEGLKVGDLVLVPYRNVHHFGYITKRFRKKVEVETTLMKRRAVTKVTAVLTEHGDPVKNKDGTQKYKKHYEKIPPVKIKVKRYFDEVKKIETGGGKMNHKLQLDWVVAHVRKRREIWNSSVLKSSPKEIVVKETSIFLKISQKKTRKLLEELIQTGRVLEKGNEVWRK